MDAGSCDNVTDLFHADNDEDEALLDSTGTSSTSTLHSFTSADRRRHTAKHRRPSHVIGRWAQDAKQMSPAIAARWYDIYVELEKQ